MFCPKHRSPSAVTAPAPATAPAQGERWRVRLRGSHKQERWRRPACPRLCTGMWAVELSATCTSPPRIRSCCWTHQRRRRLSSAGARRRVPAGVGEEQPALAAADGPLACSAPAVLSVQKTRQRLCRMMAKLQIRFCRMMALIFRVFLWVPFAAVLAGQTHWWLKRRQHKEKTCLLEFIRKIVKTQLHDVLYKSL